MGCNCVEKKAEEENEINNEDNENKDVSEPEIQNPFNPEEYENVILTEKKEHEEEITNLDSNLQMENEQTIYNNKFNNTTLALINDARRNPQAYAQKILDNIQYILNENGKIVFKRKVKVLLNRGEAAFREAADELNNLSPMNELVMKPEIIIPLPESTEEMNDNNLLRNKVIKMCYEIKCYCMFILCHLRA